MNFLDLVKQRQSVRRYIDKEVPRDKIERCLHAARLAPSASNSQPWKFTVVDDPGLVKKVAFETYGPLMSFNKFVSRAPVIIVVTLENMKIVTKMGAVVKDRKYNLIDIGIASEHFCLQAAEEGLGTCMLGWFNEKPIKKLLGIPNNKRIGLLISLGYPPEDYRQREKIRKDDDEVVSYNKY